MKVMKCSRCQRRYRGQGDWNATVERGVIVGVLCPDCQTPDENAEAEINAATLDYKRDQAGVSRAGRRRPNRRKRSAPGHHRPGALRLPSTTPTRGGNPQPSRSRPRHRPARGRRRPGRRSGRCRGCGGRVG